ncbi:acetylornithine deacetylase/succinyl-diaminopimelate desuccinylase-like protein [Sinorhizobium fredii]
MMADITPVLGRADANLPASLERLFDLVRIQSISTDPAFKAECRKAAEWLVAELEALGFEASVRDTPGHPMVVAHHAAEKASAPHLLFYGHYDVQPVDPLNLWDAPPFEPAIKELEPGRKVITGRGTSDDKGQLLTFVEAVRAYKETHKALPCRITILFEGEEESGSPSLKPFLEANAAELKADYALICDTGMWDRETPAVSAGLRGLVGEEIVVTAADRDLHSGLFGGAAANPIHILTDILAGLHDGTGRVTLDNFYDGVEETPVAINGELGDARQDGREIPRRCRPFHSRRGEGAFGAGTDLGTANRGGQRHQRRLYRRRLQDGDRRAGLRQGLLPPRRRPGPGKDPRELPRLCPLEDSGGLLG